MCFSSRNSRAARLRDSNILPKKELHWSPIVDSKKLGRGGRMIYAGILSLLVLGLADARVQTSGFYCRSPRSNIVSTLVFVTMVFG